MDNTLKTVGIDVGSACVKAVVFDGNAVIGSAVVPTRGRFQDRARDAMAQALDDAGLTDVDQPFTCATGFAPDCVGANTSQSIVSSLILGAHASFPEAMSLVDLGGEDPKVISIDKNGKRTALSSLRKCASGSGLFLDLVARRLDVHPSRLQSLACNAESPADIGSYCSVFALSQVYERLRDGASPAEVAAGAMESVAERVFEAGGFFGSVMVSGGLAEYYPDVLQALSRHIKQPVKALPGPILIPALGAAIKARQIALHEHSELQTLK